MVLKISMFRNLQFFAISAFVVAVIFFGSSVKIAAAYGECTQYGIMSYYDILSYSCKCMSGYIFKNNLFGGLSCISADTACKDQYGYGAQSDYLTNQCKCKSGYLWGTNYSGKTQCVDEDTYCRDKYGLFSSYDSLRSSCKCGYGYVMGTGVLGTSQCVYGNTVCHSRHGYNSSYNDSASSCECDDGYTMDEQNQCVKKQNNVYFTLKDINTDERDTIIKSDYDGSYYKISYGIGCLSSTFRRYLGKQLVVNLGTDFSVDIFDKLVLQEDRETCDITRVSRVSSNTTLEEPVERQSSLNSFLLPQPVCPANSLYSVTTSTCACNLGFIPDESKTTCVPSTTMVVDSVLTERMKGRILLQVEDGGQAWYVNPVSGKRMYLPNGLAAYNLMRLNSLGIEDAELAKIPLVDSEQSMLSSTSVCKTNALGNRLKGRILLQVQQSGKAWYIHPEKCRRIYLKDGDSAYKAMRLLSLGIKNVEISKIAIGE